MAEDGVAGLFKGSFSYVMKMVAVNISLTGPYDYLNEKMWITFGDFGWNEPVSMAWAAMWATFFTLPFDNIKTKMMRQFSDPSMNRLTYQNWRDCIALTLNLEGFSGFYAGMYPYYGKMFTMCLLTVWMTDMLTNSYKRKSGLQEWQI
jgi:solute carrier family 25 oxoglutarate transporter 11